MQYPVINIITLSNRTDRHQLFMEQLADTKVRYKIWNAIEDTETPYKGISKSHRMIVQDAKEKGLKSCLIAEDDFKFTSGKSFEYFINDSSVCDILFGGVSGGEFNEKTNRVFNFSGLFFYKINENFYDCFLAADQEKQLDRWLGYRGLEEIEKILGRQPVYKLCYPMPVICHDGYSDNSKKMMEHKQYFAAYKQYNG